MSVFEKLEAATENRDAEAYIALLDDNCVFVRHQSGASMNKAQISDMLRKMMSPGGATMGKRRCIYENGDILVVHSINEYPDGTREAVLGAYSLKGGKIVRLETGATSLPA
jgi:ketosteroid isomerase-like protein